MMDDEHHQIGPENAAPRHTPQHDRSPRMPAPDLSNTSTSDLVDELTRRGDMPRCRCGRWKTYIGVYDSDGKTLRCHGCRRAVTKCTCG